MDLAVWLSAPLTLVGVWLGGFLSSRAQDRTWKREQSQLSRDVRRAVYSRLVATVRQYRSYVVGPHAQVDVWLWDDPGGRRLAPGIGADGATYQEAMEASFTEVLMVAEDQETIDRAHFLTGMARRTAVARAIYGSDQIPNNVDGALFVAERSFIECARRDLGLPVMDRDPHPRSQELIDIDAHFMRAYRDE